MAPFLTTCDFTNLDFCKMYVTIVSWEVFGVYKIGSFINLDGASQAPEVPPAGRLVPALRRASLHPNFRSAASTPAAKECRAAAPSTQAMVFHAVLLLLSLLLPRASAMHSQATVARECY